MKNLLQNNEFQLDEILFENRNKNYGAYALRNNADHMLTKSMFLGIGVFAMIAITPLLINAFNSTETIVAVPEPPPFVITEVSDPPVAPPEVVHTTPPAQTNVATIDSRLVTPTRDPKKETVMPKQSDYNDAVVGVQNIIGEPPVISYDPPVIHTVPGNVQDIVPPKPVDNSPKTRVDIEAKFMGGIDAFRNNVVNKFDTSVMDGTSEVVRTTITFIVEKDGTISEVKASGSNSDFNRQAEKTVKAVKGKWVPAKLNGENVRSYFKFPITMQFE